jgi:hypothetical protein
MKTSSISASAIALALASSLSLPAIAGQKPADRCNLASLNGSYGYAISGIVIDGGAATNLAFAGTMTFDGAGNVSGSDITNFGGQAQPLETFTGTYKVKGNCTGTYTVQSTESGTLSGYFSIVADGTEIELVGTEPGAIYAGPAKKR